MNLTQLVRNLEKELKRAEKLAKSYDQEADKLRNKLADVAEAIGSKVQSVLRPSSSSVEGRGKNLSASGKAKIAAAQKKRWEEYRARHGKSVKKTRRGRKSGKMSAEGRKRIAEAQKKRWAAYRKENANA
jgi:hypothetical protein